MNEKLITNLENILNLSKELIILIKDDDFWFNNSQLTDLLNKNISVLLRIEKQIKNITFFPF